MASAFKKISRVGRVSGGVKWYLSDDCLLAAKRVMYVVEYRRFYLRDLESILVWPSRVWLLRPIIPGVLLALLAWALLHWANTTAAAICSGIGLAWVVLELVLGPTAEARVQTTGAVVALPLVKRKRSAQKVLAKIDAAVLAARGGALEQPAALPAEPHLTGVPAASQNLSANSEAAPAATPIGDAT